MEHTGNYRTSHGPGSHSQKKTKRIKRTRSPVHQNEQSSNQTFYRSTNIPLTYSTTTGQQLVANGNYQPVMMSSMAQQQYQQKMAHQFMLKQQIRYSDVNDMGVQQQLQHLQHLQQQQQILHHQQQLQQQVQSAAVVMGPVDQHLYTIEPNFSATQVPNNHGINSRQLANQGLHGSQSQHSQPVKLVPQPQVHDQRIQLNSAHVGGMNYRQQQGNPKSQQPQRGSSMQAPGSGLSLQHQMQAPQNNQHLAYFQGMYNEMILKQGPNNNGIMSQGELYANQMGQGLTPYGGNSADMMRNLPTSQSQSGHHGVVKRKMVQKVHTSGLTNTGRLQSSQQDNYEYLMPHQSSSQLDASPLESSFTISGGPGPNSQQVHPNRANNATAYGGHFNHQQRQANPPLFDLSGSGQIMTGSLSTGGATFLQQAQPQHTPNQQVLSKYNSALVHNHPGGVSDNISYEHETNDGGTTASGHQLQQTISVQKVRLPEIAYGVQHSAIVPADPHAQQQQQRALSKTMNNYNSDPYALRLNQQKIKDQQQQQIITTVTQISHETKETSLATNKNSLIMVPQSSDRVKSASKLEKEMRKQQEGAGEVVRILSPNGSVIQQVGGEPSKFQPKSQGAEQQFYTQPHAQHRILSQAQHTAQGANGNIIHFPNTFNHLQHLDFINHRGPGSAQQTQQQQQQQQQQQPAQWMASSQMSAPQPHRQSNNQFSPGQNSMVSNIKSIYKDIKREKSSGQQQQQQHSQNVMNMATQAGVNHQNSGHSRTNSHNHQAPQGPSGPQAAMKVAGGVGAELQRRPAAIGTLTKTTSATVKVRESPSQQKNRRQGIGAEKFNSQRMGQQIVTKQPGVAGQHKATVNTFVQPNPNSGNSSRV